MGKYPPKKVLKKACKWPGCLSLADASRGCCKAHVGKWRYHFGGVKQYDQARRRVARSLKMKAWMARPKTRREPKDCPPLTPDQERIKQQEVTRLLTLYPHHPIQWAASKASDYARAGGRWAYGHRCAIQSRKAGWRRKWLREGSLDLSIVDGAAPKVPPKEDCNTPKARTSKRAKNYLKRGIDNA